MQFFLFGDSSFPNFTTPYQVYRTCFVETHALRHHRISCECDIKPPNHCHVVTLPAGVICAIESEIGISGNSSFTNNSADYFGGEKIREMCIAYTAGHTTTS